MRRVMFVVGGISLMLMLGAMVASAQTQITFGPSTQNVTFKGTGGSTVDVALGSCSGSTCTLSDGGGGVIENGSTISSGTWSIVTTLGANPVTVSNGTAPLSINMNGATSQFTFTSNCTTGPSCTASGSITGDVTFTLLQNPSGQVILDASVTNMAGTGDFMTLLSSLFPQGKGNMDVVLNAFSSGSVSGLFGTTNSLASNVSSGQITPVPEPLSAFLFGSGLLTVGTVLRRRRKA